MGSVFAKLFSRSRGRDTRVLMLGLDSAGKTTILYKFKIGQVVVTIPTIGFNVETLEFKNFHLTVWDIGGQDKLRCLWRHYYTGSGGIVFVVDSADRARMGTVREELHKLFSEPELNGVPLLVLANKNDLPKALPAEEVAEELGLTTKAPQDRKWHVQSCCATNGEGLMEGMEWLVKILKQ